MGVGLRVRGGTSETKGETPRRKQGVPERGLGSTWIREERCEHHLNKGVRVSFGIGLDYLAQRQPHRQPLLLLSAPQVRVRVPGCNEGLWFGLRKGLGLGRLGLR